MGGTGSGPVRSEVYGSEEFIGRVIAGQRNRVFLVSIAAVLVLWLDVTPLRSLLG
jgi:hypothetical protein